MEEFFKLCPECGEKQVYGCKSVLTLAIKENRICNSCRSKLRRTHNIDKLEKNCPKCGNTQIYNNRKIFNRSIKGSWLCKKCATKESSKCVDRSFQKTKEYREKMSKSCSGKKHTNQTKEKLKKAAKEQWKNNREKMLKILKSDDYIIKQINSQKLKWNNIEFRKKMSVIHNSDEYRKKRREIVLKHLKNKLNGKLSSYNKKACEFIDKINKNFNWNLKHALCAEGEFEVCGFLVDGYDNEKNIIFEYDEPKHYYSNNKLKNDDLYRQNIIINNFHPNEFWRYNERNNELYEVISERSISCPQL